MEENKQTFAHNWYENRDTIFQMLLSHEIDKAFPNPPDMTPIFTKEVGENKHAYIINDEPVLIMHYDPEQAIETIYVRSEKSERRSKNIPRGSGLPTARIQ